MPSRVLLGAWGISVVLATLSPAASHSPIVGPSGGDLLRNAILFLPLGWLCAGRGGSLLPLAALAAGLSLAIEAAQWAVPGRDPSPWDLAANTLGGGFGWVAARGLRRRATPVPVRFLAVLASYAGILVATAWLFAPELPAARYFGGWGLDLGHLATYSGRVLSAEVGEQPVVPGGEVADSESLRAALRRGDPVRIRGVDGPDPPASLAPVVSLHDEFQREIFLLGRRADEWVLRRWTRAARLRFEAPFVETPVAVPNDATGRPFDLILRPIPGGYSVEAVDAAPRAATLTLGRGWSLLVPGEAVPSWTVRWLDLLWLAALGALVGSAVPVAPRAAAGLARVLTLALPVATPMLLLGAVSLAMPTVALPSLAEWISLAMGASVGVGLSCRRGPPNRHVSLSATCERLV